MKLEKILQLEESIICCENKEQLNKLLEKLEGLGYVWISGKKLTYYDFIHKDLEIYLFIRKNKVSWSYCEPNDYYTYFVDIDDFKEQENHEKDVCDYCIIVKKVVSISKNMLIVNKEKKYVLFKFNGKEYRVDCHEEDKFNWEIGFGLALSKAFGKNAKWEKTREFYRNKNRKLNCKEYAKWCITEYFRNDVILFNDLKKAIKEINEYGKVDL